METNCSDENPKLKLKSQCYVKPTHLAIDPQKYSYELGFHDDLNMLSMEPMQKGLLFNTNPFKFESNFLQKFKKSLSISLDHFYPLSCRIATRKFYDEHACSFYVDCDVVHGARFIHAVVDLNVSDIVSSIDVHPIVESLFDLGERSVNYDGHTRALLSIQVTELIDGIFIAFTMNHCIADGASLSYFISTLSEIFGQLKDDHINEGKFSEITISRKPIFEKLFQLDHVYNTFSKVPYLEPEEFIYRYVPDPLRARIFHFSSKSISLLKSKANEQCGLHNNIFISSLQALCGLTLRSITRARNLQPDLEVHCNVIVNYRTRVNPPIPSKYFRCFIGGAISAYKSGELLANNLGQIALSINETIKSRDDENIRATIKRSMDNPCVPRPGPSSVNYKPNKVIIVGSSKFNVYGPEFGLGKPVTVLPGCANKYDGKVRASPGRDGGGSIDLWICLKPETMNALELDEEFMSFTTK